MAVYGYVRVSTIQQKTQRQIDNIRAFCADATIYEEKQSAKDIESRTVFRRLIDKAKSGDTIIFDEVSRMSRNAEEGYNLYMALLERGVELVFLKERHIDTAEYRRRTQNHIGRISSGDKKTEKLINGIFDLIEEFEKDNLKDNIRLAFNQAQHERQFLIKRVKEGKTRSDKHQGRPEGSRNINTSKADRIKKVIREQSKDFDGRFTDAKILQEYLPGTARNTYYRYKKELKAAI